MTLCHFAKTGDYLRGLLNTETVVVACERGGRGGEREEGEKRGN